jgi:hypothetical protein
LRKETSAFESILRLASSAEFVAPLRGVSSRFNPSLCLFPKAIGPGHCARDRVGFGFDSIYRVIELCQFGIIVRPTHGPSEADLVPFAGSDTQPLARSDKDGPRSKKVSADKGPGCRSSLVAAATDYGKCPDNVSWHHSFGLASDINLDLGLTATDVTVSD